MLKWNLNSAGCREHLEPSGPAACLEQEFCQHQCIWIRPTGLDTPRCENFHGWRVYSCASTAVLPPVLLLNCPASALIHLIVQFEYPMPGCYLFMAVDETLAALLCSFSPSSWKQSSDCPLATFSWEWEVWAPWTSSCRQWAVDSQLSW